MEQAAVATNLDDASQDESAKYIIFGLAGETYGVPILQAQEIIADYELTVLPHLPDFFDGVISMRGEAVPVINLRKRFDIATIERSVSSRIVIIEMEPTPIGILVDKVFKVDAFRRNEIEAPPTFSMSKKARFVNGVIETNKKKFAIILDMQQILTTEEKIELESIKKIIESKTEEDRKTIIEGGERNEVEGKRAKGKKKRARVESEAEIVTADDPNHDGEAKGTTNDRKQDSEEPE